MDHFIGGSKQLRAKRVYRYLFISSRDGWRLSQLKVFFALNVEIGSWMSNCDTVGFLTQQINLDFVPSIILL